MDDEYSFTIVNNDGVEVVCDVLSMITDKDSNVYILYTDYFLNEDGSFRLLASQLVQEGNDFSLKEIEDKALVKELMNSSKNLYDRTIKGN